MNEIFLLHLKYILIIENQISLLPNPKTFKSIHIKETNILYLFIINENRINFELFSNLKDLAHILFFI